MENKAQETAGEQSLDDMLESVVDAQSALQRLEHALYLSKHSRSVTFQITAGEKDQLEGFLRAYRLEQFE